MIQNTRTFQYCLYEAIRRNPRNVDTAMSVPEIREDLDSTKAVSYKGEAFLPNPVFLVELYENRRNPMLNLGLYRIIRFKSEFANKNLAKKIY